MQYKLHVIYQIDRVWVGAGIDSNTDPSVIGETLKKMTYLDVFFKEVLRYNSPVQHIFRTCFKQVQFCGYNIPSNTLVCIDCYFQALIL